MEPSLLLREAAVSTEILSALRATTYFRGLDSASLAPLLRGASIQVVGRGEEASDRSRRDALILVSGAARVMRTGGGDRSVGVSLIQQGDLLCGLPSPAGTEDHRVEFLAPSRILSLRMAGLEAVMLAQPAVALRVIETMARRLIALERHLVAAGSQPVPARVAAILVEVGERYGIASRTEVRVDLALTHGQIAELAATTRETVTKIASWLRRHGIVTITRREIRIVDPSALSEIATGTRTMPGRLTAAR
jgi:CRP/FNR family cyclic AMP-dependent transcriptional regulator